MSQKVKFIISYDGSNFHGWQKQPRHHSIQAEIESALFKLTHIHTPITGAGRTDAKVHAKGQVAHATIVKALPLLNLQNGLNRHLPSTIRIESVEYVPSDFHSRFDAKQKTYSYHIHLGKVLSPFKKNFMHHVTHPLFIEPMLSGAKLLEGTHNFKSFAHHCHKGAASTSPIKTIHSLKLDYDQETLIISITASGFLYKMCRNIVGTLIDIGRKKLSPSQIPIILKMQNRIYAPSTAPATGLFLDNIIY